jgi:hypothetical protein
MSQACESLFALPPLDFLTKDKNTTKQSQAIRASRETRGGTKESKVTEKRRSTRLKKSTTKSGVSRKRKGTKKRKPIISVPTTEGPGESLAMNQAMGSSSTVNMVARTGYDPAAEQEISENPENNGADSEALNAISGFKSGDLDQRPGGTRKMPSRRSRLNVSYTVPSYFFDKTVMGK